MTGRSGFSATQGVKSLRKHAGQIKDHYAGSTQMRTNKEKKANREFFNGKEASKIPVVPLKSSRSRSPDKLQGRDPGFTFNPQVQPLEATLNVDPHDLPPIDDEPFDEFEAAHPDMAAQMLNEGASDGKDLVDQQLNDMDEQIDERDPKLYVEVNIGKNCIEKIVVYEGDTADSLAEAFCQKHNLDMAMKEKLKIRLEH